MSPVHSGTAPARRSVGVSQPGGPSFLLTCLVPGSSLVFERIPPCSGPAAYGHPVSKKFARKPVVSQGHSHFMCGLDDRWSSSRK